MSTENLAYINRNLKYLGFGDEGRLNRDLAERMAANDQEITLTTEAWFEEDTRMEVSLLFKKSNSSGRYYISKYDAVLRYLNDESKNRLQTFYVFRGSGVTFKEAFNLLNGRSVNKDFFSVNGDRYNAWIQLNFEEKDLHNNYKMVFYREHYNYQLEQVLDKYPIREMKIDELRVHLIRSLKRGNMQVVTFIKTLKSEKMFIEACPRTKSINIYSLATRAKSNMEEITAFPIPEEEAKVMAEPNREMDEEEELETEPAELELEEAHPVGRAKKARR